MPHLIRLRQWQEKTPDLGRLAAVAGAILAFVTVAIPLQLEKQWITIGWALLGCALAWLFLKVPHRGLLVWSSALLAVVFARLVLNPAVFAYHPKSALPIFNWYLYTYLVSAACFFATAWLLRKEGKTSESTESSGVWTGKLPPLLTAAGAALLFLLLNIEIADFFSKTRALTFNFSHGSLAQDLSYTIGWAIYAILTLCAGVFWRNRLTRIAAIGLLALTVFKAFIHDLSRLSGLYRVASFVGLAFCLAIVAVVLQKFVLHSNKTEA